MGILVVIVVDDDPLFLDIATTALEGIHIVLPGRIGGVGHQRGAQQGVDLAAGHALGQ